MDLSQLLRALGLQQAYQSYQQNIGQPFANIAGPFGRGLLGLDRPEYGEEQAYRTGQAMGNMPAVSAPVGAFKAAAQVPGLLADATQAMKGLDLAGLLGLTAYHGSPYRFSKFDPTKIGTGEGAQAYGYGHYFAEAPGVAKTYQPRSPKFEEKLLGMYEKASSANNFPMMEVLEQAMLHRTPSEIIQQFTNVSDGYTKQHAKAAEDFAKWFSKNKPEVGGLYTVDIPDEMIGRMLDWDKPLGQQSETIQRLAKQVGLEMDDLGGDLVARFNAKRPEGAMLLREQGIPGIRYYDQASRPSDITSRKLVDLYNKYGDIDKAVDEMMRTVHNTPKEKQKIREQFVEKLQTGLTRNFVVFPGEEEAIKMLKVE